MPQYLAHRIKLSPSKKAEAYFRQACGISRSAYNWAYFENERAYEAGEKTQSGYDLDKKFNSIKHEQFPWVALVTCWAAKKSIYDFADALQRFFKDQSGYPNVKKKGRCRDSFYVDKVHFKLNGKYIKLPKLPWIKMCQELRFPGVPKSVVISREANSWYASILVDVDDTYQYPHVCTTENTVGIDLGITTLITASNGDITPNIKATKKYERRLRRADKELHRRVNGSNNRAKSKLKIEKTHLKTKNVRKDAINKATARLVRENRYIGMETLNTSGMMKNRKLSKAIQDASFHEIKRQLEYKAKLSNSTIVFADRWFPSSKLCSCCGYKNEDLVLSDRSWTCEQCQVTHDRDGNAAQNLNIVARGYRDTLNACRVGVRPGNDSIDSTIVTRQLTMKQEVNNDQIVIQGQAGTLTCRVQA